MKRNLCLRLSLILSSAALLALPSLSQAQTVANSGFETGTENQPDGWYADWPQDATKYVVFKWDDQIKRSGQRSVSIQIAKGHPPRNIHYNWTTTLDGWKAGKAYEMTGWVKTQGLKDPAFLVIQCWKKKPGQPPEKWEMLGSQGTQRMVNGTQDWTQVNARFLVPKGTTEVRLRAGISASWNHSCTVWFDDIQVVEIPQ